MQIIKENKVLFIICGSLIIFTLIVVLIFSERGAPEEELFFGRQPFLRNYGINEIIPITITNEQMARMYLADYINLIINNPQQAYGLLEEEYRLREFPSFESFIEHIDSISNQRFYGANLQKYEVRLQGGYRIFNVVDVAGNNFVFREISIMNYEVFLDNNSI